MQTILPVLSGLAAGLTAGLLLARRRDRGLHETDQSVEHLIVEVPAQQLQEWLRAEHETWTKRLCSSPAFLGKEIWVDESLDPRRVHVIIYWLSTKAWKAAFTQEQIRTTDRALASLLSAPPPRILSEESGGRWRKILEFRR